MAEQSEPIPSLAESTIYVHTGSDITTWGRWFLCEGDVVVYQRPSGELELTRIVSATSLRAPRGTWTQVGTNAGDTPDDAWPAQHAPKAVGG
ncbi:hypothetical protein [Amycolatopsis minnesotensis]|uniref:hypothetical protein n=1 Tax=Amycolatopsis minnesotensis TaxID=337894 RepID=UPI0031DF180B